MEQGRQLPRTALRFGLSTMPPQGEDNRGEDSEGEASPFPRTVFTWGGTFAIYQSRKRPGNHELLEILKREADMDFPTFFIKPSSRSSTLCTR